MDNADHRSARPTPAAALWLVFFCLIWGLNMVAIKVGNPAFGPVTQVAARSLAAALLLGPFLLMRRIPLLHRGPVLFWGALTGVLFAGEFLTLFLGLSEITASRGMVLLYTSPFWMTAGAHLFLGERLTLPKVAGLAVAFLGTGAVLGEHLWGGTASLRGDLLCLAGGLFWAAMTLVIKARLTERISPVQSLWYQLLFSSPLLLLAAALMESGREPVITPLAGWSFVFQVTVVVLGSYLGWYWLVHRFAVGRLSAYLFLAPAFGVIAGALLLGEPLPPNLLLGLLAIGSGIFLVNR